jgi:hypothetical protein
VSTMDVRVRMGDAIDPFQLANGFEAVIGYECQERSNPPSLTRTIQTIHARCDKASEWVGGSFPVRNSFASAKAQSAGPARPVCVFITAGPFTKLCAWGRRRVEDMCYEIRRAEACVD